jgi:chromosome partitioning protein
MPPMPPKAPKAPKAPAAPRLTVAVLNQKGGVGKTTLAVNLASASHLSGQRTLVLDLDTQGSAMDWSAARQEGSPLDGLSVARADKALTLPRFRELAAGYDVAILDGPARLGDITCAAAVAADVALVPLRPGLFDWWASPDTLDLLDSADGVRAQLDRPPVRRVFVLNAGDERTRIARAALEALAKIGELAPVTIAHRVVYIEAVTAGGTVLTVAPDSPAADEVRRLWGWLSENGGGR